MAADLSERSQMTGAEHEALCCVYGHVTIACDQAVVCESLIYLVSLNTCGFVLFNI